MPLVLENHAANSAPDLTRAAAYRSQLGVEAISQSVTQ
jgi:hypothetical protein